jgi:Uma2 family endonuclease
MASNVKHLMTVKDLEALPDDGCHRYELIEGELHVSPAPTIPHQLVLNNLLFELTNYLRQNPIGILVPGPGAELSEYNYVIPDIAFARYERLGSIVTKDQFIAAPDLMIEIVSPGSKNRKRDLKLKHTLYEKYGVQEYWAVECWSRSVIVFRLNGNTLEEVRALKDEDDELESALFPGLSLKLSIIFANTQMLPDDLDFSHILPWLK